MNTRTAHPILPLVFLFCLTLSLAAKTAPNDEPKGSRPVADLSLNLDDEILKKLSLVHQKKAYHLFLTEDGFGIFGKVGRRDQLFNRQRLFDSPEARLADPESLKPIHRTTSIRGVQHEYFQQTHQGVPVFNTFFQVHSDRRDRVIGVQSRLAHAPQSFSLNEAVFSLSEAEVLRAVGRVLPAPTGRVLSFEKLFYPRAGELVPAFRVVVFDRVRTAEWECLVDNRGELLQKTNQIKFSPRATAGSLLPRGRVFEPSPVIALKNPNLQDRDDADYPDLSSAYREVLLPGLDGSGYLRGLHVDLTAGKKPGVFSKGDFLFHRGEPGFEEVMVYYHLDRAQRYLQSLGFTRINADPQKVDAHASDDDNSWFSPGQKLISYGTGGVDDAEDADIILHEYGHAIQESIIPGFGRSHEASCVGEGFSDYFACVLNSGEGYLAENFGDWDAVAYAETKPAYLRRVVSEKKYPNHMEYECHADGEIWSASLWELRAAMDGRECDRLVIESHFYLTPGTSFQEAVQALITADGELFGGRHRGVIIDVFTRRGILSPESTPEAAGAANWERLSRFERLHRAD